MRVAGPTGAKPTPEPLRGVRGWSLRWTGVVVVLAAVGLVSIHDVFLGEELVWLRGLHEISSEEPMCPQPQTWLFSLVSGVLETTPGTGRAANQHSSPAS